MIYPVRYAVLLLLLLPIQVQAQASPAAKADSLEQLLPTLNNPEARFEHLITLVEQYRYLNIDKSLLYAHEGLQLAKQLKKTNLLARAYGSKAFAYYHNSDYELSLVLYDSALSLSQDPSLNFECLKRKGDNKWYLGFFSESYTFYRQAFELAQSMNNRKLLGIILLDLGDYYRQVGEYQKAIDAFFQGFEYNLAENNLQALAKGYNNISIVFNHLGLYQKEIEYCFKSLEIKEVLKDGSGVGLMKNNIAEVYRILGDYEKALRYSDQALNENNVNDSKHYRIFYTETRGRILLSLDSIEQAEKYFTESLELSERLREKRYIARNNRHLGNLYLKRNQLARSIFFLEKALNVYDQIEDPKNETETSLGLSKAYFQQKNYDRSRTLAAEVESIALKKGYLPLLAEVYAFNSHMLEHQGRLAEAIKSYKKYDSIKGLILKQENLKNIIASEISHNTRQKELENISLRKNMEVQQGIIKQQKLNSIVGISFTLILGLFSIALVWAYRKTQKAKTIISEQNQALIIKNSEIEKANEQQTELMQIVAHDLKSPLNSINGLVSVMKMEGNLTDTQQEYLQMIQQVTEKNSHFISDLLGAHQIEKKSLQPKLQSTTIHPLLIKIKSDFDQQAEQKQQKISYNSSIPRSLKINTDPELLTHIIGNLLSNAIKFSNRGTSIDVSVISTEDTIQIKIKDQGQGFSEEDMQMAFKKFQRLSARPTNNESSSGLGLYIVKTLAESLGGQIELSSQPRQGATFTLILPL